MESWEFQLIEGQIYQPKYDSKLMKYVNKSSFYKNCSSICFHHQRLKGFLEEKLLLFH